jgi:HSP20 family protein
MADSQWDPLRDMEELLARYGRSAAVQPLAHGRSEHIATADWRPVVDISETAELYLIEAEIPGVKREDVRVGVEDGVLTIRGHRELPRAAGAESHRHRTERSGGRFARSFALPELADPERITARVEDGVLSITVAKRAAGGSRSIEIRVG